MQLLEDTFIIENLQIINEGAGSGPMKIRGCFQRADEANNNKRIYSKPLLDREINKLAESISERRLMGELDHPQHDSVKLSNVSHLITGLNMKGNEVIGEAEILNTPSGKVAKALIEGGVKVGISSRGMGTVSEDLDGTRHVNEDFRLITWDLVADPSTRGAYPGLTESTEIQEIIDRVLPEAQKVKNFTTLLKEELNEKTRWQKEAEKRAKPSGDGGEIATFQTMSGSRRRKISAGGKLAPDLTPATVRSYKAASAPGGLGKKAATAADDASKPSKKPGIVGRVVSKLRSVLSTKKQKAKRVAQRVALKRDAREIRSLRTARARLRKGGDSREARPISHPGGENRNPLARGMPVLKRMEDRLKSGGYQQQFAAGSDFRKNKK